MPLLKPSDTVIIDAVSFEKFMDYRSQKKLATDWGWMQLPAGTLMEVTELIFRTTGSRRRKKIDDEGKETFRRGRSCWIKCSIISPARRVGEEHIIPSWILKKAVVSHVESSAGAA